METDFQHIVVLCDPFGKGRITSTDSSLDEPSPTRKARPVVISGVRYDSHSHAALALGVTQSAISLAVRQGKNLDNVQPRPKYEIMGMEFDTIKAACEFFNITPYKLKPHITRIYST